MYSVFLIFIVILFALYFMYEGYKFTISLENRPEDNEYLTESQIEELFLKLIQEFEDIKEIETRNSDKGFVPETESQDFDINTISNISLHPQFNKKRL